MQKFKLETIFSLAIALLIGMQSQSFAQSYGDAFIVQEKAEAKAHRKFGKPESQKLPDGAFLQGASCGTIGPQGGDATSIMGINTAAVERPRPVETFPLVPTFLISMLSISALTFGIRTLISQKRAQLWLVGSIAAGALLFAGFLWAAVSGPNLTFGLSMIDSARQMFNSSLTCF